MASRDPMIDFVSITNINDIIP